MVVVAVRAYGNLRMRDAYQGQQRCHRDRARKSSVISYLHDKPKNPVPFLNRLDIDRCPTSVTGLNAHNNLRIHREFSIFMN